MTSNQLVRFGRQKKKHKKKNRALDGRPQLAGVITRLTADHKPKKPNSANRKTVRVKLSNGKTIVAYVPGEGTAAKCAEHTAVLIEGGGPKDLVGVKYTLVMGALGMEGGSPGRTAFGGGPRRQQRSKYGVKRRSA